MEIGTVPTEGGTEKIKLSSRQSEEQDVWAMQYFPVRVQGRDYKLSELVAVEKGQMPQEVAKENQQYRLCLQYEYIGASEQGHKLLEKDLKEFEELLPMGYSTEAVSNSWSWGGKDNKQYHFYHSRLYPFYGGSGERRLLVSSGCRNYWRVDNVCNRDFYSITGVDIKKKSIYMKVIYYIVKKTSIILSYFFVTV